MSVCFVLFCFFKKRKEQGRTKEIHSRSKEGLCKVKMLLPFWWIQRMEKIISLSSSHPHFPVRNFVKRRIHGFRHKEKNPQIQARPAFLLNNSVEAKTQSVSLIREETVALAMKFIWVFFPHDVATKLEWTSWPTRWFSWLQCDEATVFECSFS